MIEALIFDCFGVLAADGWSPFKRKYLQDPNKAAAVAKIGKAVDEGELTYEDMIRKTAEIADIDEIIVRSAVGQKFPNEELFAVIERTLKPRYKIGMLSNASYNVTNRLFSEDQSRLFDAVALSYEVGLTKPDPKMYETIASRLGVSPEACVMIDDKASHCAGAINAGMQAIEYESLDDLMDMLATVGVELG